jgi:transcriptional regulator with XRE-family HTH domain
MNQPELGKKIAELRKAKGLTQEELVEKCNLSVRTLQRIESGDVTPRSYTIKTIFVALDYTIYDSSENNNNRFSKTGFIVSKWLEQFYRYVLDLFNLKTQKMKKITILSIMLLSVFLGLFAICSESKAQKVEKAIKAIEGSQNKINKWINIGQVDSILTFYREDACVLPTLTGKTEIREMLKSAFDVGYKQIEFKTLYISVSDSIAIQKYYDVSEFNGGTVRRQGLTEWRLTKGKWLIVNDIMINY